MDIGPQLLLIAAVAGVGVLHTVVPDHWVPIALIARQRGWTKAETARAALQAGTGHVVSTLIIALVVWIGGALVAARFGQFIDTLSSIALIGFGGWIAVMAWRDLHNAGGPGHSHGHSHAHEFESFGGDVIHGPELQTIATPDGVLNLSIYEWGVPPHFRLTGASADADAVSVETLRPDGARQVFRLKNHGTHWQSPDEIPEPHGFNVVVTVRHGGNAHNYPAQFIEHIHDHDGGHNDGHAHGHDDGHDHGHPARDDLYAPLAGDAAALTHVHPHRHGEQTVHDHRHDHPADTAHAIDDGVVTDPPVHTHRHKTTARTALLLIVGSSPMVEGIPAFFAASRYGVPLIVVMSLVFAVSTIATYVVLCVYSTAGLQRLRLGAVERYGEVLSGVFIALVGVAFWIWPVL